jgi:hypothetical protein
MKYSHYKVSAVRNDEYLYGKSNFWEIQVLHLAQLPLVPAIAHADDDACCRQSLMWPCAKRGVNLRYITYSQASTCMPQSQ